MIERFELDNSRPDDFGLYQGAVLAVRTGLSETGFPGTTNEDKRLSDLRWATLTKVDRLYHVRMRNQLSDKPLLHGLELPMWFDAITEGEMVIHGLRTFADHYRPRPETDPAEPVNFSLPALFASGTIPDYVIEQNLQSPDAEKLASDIDAFRQYVQHKHP